MIDLAEKRRLKGWDTLFYFFSVYICFPLFKIYHRAERIGFQNVPLKGPFIAISNHSSFLDPWYISAMLPIRHIHYLVTTKWYLKSRVWRFFFDSYGCIPVNPGNMNPSTIKAILRALTDGEAVGIFPEGRVTDDGELQKFHPGALYIAVRAKVPVIPIAVCGSYETLPRDRKVPYPYKLRIVFGKQVIFSDILHAQTTAKEIYIMEMQKIRTWIADQLAQFKEGR